MLEEDEDNEFEKNINTNNKKFGRQASDEKDYHKKNKEVNLSFQNKKFKVGDFKKKQPSMQDLDMLGRKTILQKKKSNGSNVGMFNPSEKYGPLSVITAKTDDHRNSNKFNFQNFNITNVDGADKVPKPNSIRSFRFGGINSVKNSESTNDRTKEGFPSSRRRIKLERPNMKKKKKKNGKRKQKFIFKEDKSI